MNKEPTVAKYTITRAEVAARLGVSTSTVRRMESCYLHPVQDASGTWLFDPAELERVPQRPPKREIAVPDLRSGSERRERAREGRIVAGIFKMFERGVPLPKIVIATKQQPEVVRRLYSEWMTSLEEGEWHRQELQRREGGGF